MLKALDKVPKTTRGGGCGQAPTHQVRLNLTFKGKVGKAKELATHVRGEGPEFC